MSWEIVLLGHVYSALKDDENDEKAYTEGAMLLIKKYEMVGICSRSFSRTIRMKIINISKSLPSKGSNGTMDKKKITTLVVHHDAMFVPARGYNTMERIKMEANFHIAKGWRHLSYHYVIDNVGDIYQCLSETEVGYHAGNLAVNKSSIAVCLHGNFEIQEPTKKQLATLKAFILWITTQRPDLPLVVAKSVKGHRDIKATACPGKNLYKSLK